MPTKGIQQELLELTEDLIRIPSTHSRPQQIIQCAGFIGQWLAARDIAYERYESNGIPHLAVLPQPAYAPILLLAHFDVVETEDRDLFKPQRKNGRLYGRGAIDDKYGVAMALLLFEEHVERQVQSGGTQRDVGFGLLLTGDEEVGGRNGAGIASKHMTADFFLAIDGGRPDLIVTREKGIIALSLEARGVAAHAARPWMGKNAFDILAQDYQVIRALFSQDRDDHWHKTATLTNCRCGNGSANIIPDRARAILDIRYTDQDDPWEIVALIQEAVASQVEVRAVEPTFDSSSSAWLDLLVEHSGNAVVGFDHGASDARWFGLRGIPGAIWGAEGELSQHTEQEHVIISSMHVLYDRLNDFLKAAQERRRQP